LHNYSLILGQPNTFLDQRCGGGTPDLALVLNVQTSVDGVANVSLVTGGDGRGSSFLSGVV
jgi:hypothetical protein